MSHIDYAIVCPPNFNPVQAIERYLRAEKLGKLLRVLAAGVLIQLVGGGALFQLWRWPLQGGAMPLVAPAGPFVVFAGMCVTLVAAVLVFRTLQEDARAPARR